jgi:ABC-type sugar transport system ATPase subunit
MADRIVVMNQGRVEQVGTADALYGAPENVFVARFIGSPAMNLVDVDVTAGVVRLGTADVARVGASATRVTLGIRPEDLRLGGSMLPGRVTLVEPMGREVLYEVATDLAALRVLDATHAARFREGETVGLDLVPGAAHLFDATSGRALPRNALPRSTTTDDRRTAEALA